MVGSAHPTVAKMTLNEPENFVGAVGMRSALYAGRVRHRRFTPVAHEFSYPLTLLYLDLSELETVFSGRWFWSAGDSEGDAALAWFRRSDHFGPRDVPLDEWVRRYVAAETGTRPEGPICVLTQPRYFGYVFNPISVYYCFDAAGGQLEVVVAEVSNTPWNERHCYVVGRPGVPLEGEQRFAKRFHVSPFMRLEQEYGWFSRPPGDTLSIHMDSYQAGMKMFDATLTLDRKSIETNSLNAALFGQPFQTARVFAAIHVQALKLWWKGVAYVPHPGDSARGNAGVLPQVRQD